MRVSEGVPLGRFAKLYNPEIFEEHDEVIVFTRDDMDRRISSIMRELDLINKISLSVDEKWRLIGYWPKIMQSVHHIDLNMDLMLKKEPLQSYLDTYLYENVKDQEKEAAISATMRTFYFEQTKLLIKNEK